MIPGPTPEELEKYKVYLKLPSGVKAVCLASAEQNDYLKEERAKFVHPIRQKNAEFGDPESRHQEIYYNKVKQRQVESFFGIPGNRYGYNKVWGMVPPSNIIMKRIINMIGIKPGYAHISILDPNIRVYPHRDVGCEADVKSRLTWAISDVTPEFSPTTFYTVKDDVTFPTGKSWALRYDQVEVSAEHYWDDYGFIIETRRHHGVLPSSKPRIMLQLQYNMEPDDLRRAIHDYAGIKVN